MNEINNIIEKFNDLDIDNIQFKDLKIINQIKSMLENYEKNKRFTMFDNNKEKERFTLIEDLDSKNNSSKFIFELTETELFTLIYFLEGDTSNFEHKNYKERTELMIKFKTTLNHFMKEFDNFIFVQKDSLSVKKEPVNEVKEIEEIKDLSHADIPEIVLSLWFIKSEYYPCNEDGEQYKQDIYISYVNEWKIEITPYEKEIEMQFYNNKFYRKFIYHTEKKLFDINKLKIKTMEEFFKQEFR